ncbi:MAG: glucan 1,4-alpha-glucosidase, partial [Terracidiphilus sp.]
LLRSALDGKIFDRIDPVYERYCEVEGRKKRRTDLEIYSRRRPIQRMDAGRKLRILDEGLFDVVWTDDDWQTKHVTPSRSLGTAGFYAEIAPAAGSRALEWTLHWPDSDGWLGYNVKIKVDAA